MDALTIAKLTMATPTKARRMESKAEYARRMRLRQKLELQQIEGEIARLRALSTGGGASGATAAAAEAAAAAAVAALGCARGGGPESPHGHSAGGLPLSPSPTGEEEESAGGTDDED
eukprot:scaffold101174_cov38-Phaeocystis_antarctica.AAC.1